MSIMSFVTGAASLFGSASGDKKSGSTRTTQNSTTKGETAAKATEAKTSAGTQTQNSTGSSTSTGSTTQAGTTVGKEQSQTTGATTNYSSDVLASLDAILTQQLGAGGGVGSAQQATDALASRLQQLQATASQPAFDVNGYVSGITESATAATQSDLDSRINSILSATGSSEGGNSMSALLGNKLRNEASANLAGITANARAQGEQIKLTQDQAITGQIGEMSGGMMANLANLLAAAKGGQQQTTGAATAVSNQQQQSAGTTQANTTESVASTGSTTDTSNTTQSGITEVNEKSTLTQKTKSNEKSGDLFTNILKAFGTSAAKA